MIKVTPTLKCTRAVISRARIKKDNLAPGTATDAVLGNWYVSMSKFMGRNVLVYMSEKSLLSFMMLEGERITPEKLSVSLIRGMILVVQMSGLNSDATERILADYSLGAFSLTDNPSLQGSLTAIMQDYLYLIDEAGGLSLCDISAITHSINHKPNKRLNWNTPFEVTQSLFKAIAT
jgi:hypothetical protein